MEFLVIGISGKKRHGKDTVASMLSKRFDERGYGTVKRGLADDLKIQVAYSLSDPMCKTVRQILNEMDYDDKKSFYRPLLQWWGTDFRRNTCGNDYWIERLDEIVNQCRAALSNDSIVFIVPDVRMPNEAQWIHDIGGKLIRVTRPDMESGDQHYSEIALDDYDQWDAQFSNLSLDILEAQVDSWVLEHFNHPRD